MTQARRTRPTSRTRLLLQASSIVSKVFYPLYIPVYATVLVMALSYLSFLPFAFRVVVLAVTWFFTVFLPRMFVRTYYYLLGMRHYKKSQKYKRNVEYIFSIFSYAVLFYMMMQFMVPAVMLLIPFAAICVMLLCLLINSFYKISAYAAAGGSIVGLLMGYSLVYSFEATIWICLSVLLCGVICTARLALRQHTLGQIALGAAIGFITTLGCAIYM